MAKTGVPRQIKHLSLKKSKKKKTISYGTHNLPLKIKDKDLKLSIEKEGNGYLYKRKLGEEQVEKVLLISSNNILINPVEPVNTPQFLTPYLLIDFSREVVIEPRSEKNIYLRFPLEIAIFQTQKKGYKLLDVLTFSKQKFTLYGPVRSGDLCKYYPSDVFFNKPMVDPKIEGIIALNIINHTNKWMNITNAVFNSFGMEIFFNQSLVSIKAKMKIRNKHVAETKVLPIPIQKGMKQAVELYKALSAPVIQKEYVMESGL